VDEVKPGDGGLAEKELTELAYEFRDYNRLYRRLRDGEREVSERRESHLGRLLSTTLRSSPGARDANRHRCVVEDDSGTPIGPSG
jgi:hypothetical protein